MNQINHKIGFIGAGNMAGAMIGAIIRAGLAPAENIMISDPSSAARTQIQASWGVIAAKDNAQLVSGSDMVVFAVKPQIIDEVLKQLSRAGAFDLCPARRLFISIAAGIPMARLEAVIYEKKTESAKKQMPVLRVMPNTPALAGAGMSGLCANEFAMPDDLNSVRTILEAMGKARVVKEDQMDAVTALSGSGPAYAFYLLEAMVEAGRRLDLSAEDSTELAQSAISGAMALIRSQNMDPETLRKNVTSPGGTTEAAISVLDKHQVKQTLISAVMAAAKRSRQLSRTQND